MSKSHWSPLLFLAVALTLFSLRPALAHPPITIPEDIREFIRLEQNYNCKLPQGKLPDGKVVIYGLPPMLPADCTPFRLYYWELPRHQVGEQNIFESQYIDPALQNLVTPAAPGGTHHDSNAKVRDFVPETETKEMQKRRDALGREPDGYLEAVRIQGRYTVVAWEAGGKKPGRWMFKFATVIPSPGAPAGTEVRNLGPITIERAVRMSDIVEEILRNETNEHSLVGFLPERFGVVIDSFGYLVREMKAVGLQIPPGSGWAVPLHGLLSGEGQTLALISSNAGKHFEGLSGTRDWLLNVLIPSLAVFVSDLYLELGVIPELHTQNIKVVLHVDPASKEPTGVILGFAFTDATDLAIDPGSRLMGGRYTYLRELRAMRSANIMNERVMGDRAMADPINHLQGFLGQTLGASLFLTLTGVDLNAAPANFFEDLEAMIYQHYLNVFLQTTHSWAGGRGYALDPAIERLQQMLSEEVLVADPSPATQRIGTTADKQNWESIARQLRPTKGMATLAMLATLTTRLPGELLQAKLIEHFRAKVTQNQSNLRSAFEKQLDAGEVLFWRLSASVSPKETWLKKKELRFAELDGIGIVAFEEIKWRGKKFPAPFASSITLDHHKARPLCAGHLLQSSDLLWHSPAREQMLALLRLLGGADVVASLENLNREAHGLPPLLE